jgi:tetratricopeptide (TPR) repeat protein
VTSSDESGRARISAVLPLAVVLIAGGGVFAALANFVSVLQAALLGLLSGIAGLIGTTLLQRRATRDRQWRAWTRLADAGPGHPAQEDPRGVLDWLDPEVEAVRFNLSRSREMRQLIRGVPAGETAEATVWVVEGDAGVGKTRLLIETCAQLEQQGWQCGWIRPGRGAELGDLDVPGGGRALLVLDDAETRTDLPEVLTALASRDDTAIRLVLVARQFGGWWAGVTARLESHVLRTLGRPGRLVLHPGGADPHGRQQLFGQAVKAFAAAWDVPAPDLKLGSSPRRLSLLDVHAVAAIAVHAGLADPVDVEQALRLLFEAEEQRWVADAADHGIGFLGIDDLRGAIVLSVLVGAGDRNEAVTLLSAIPGLAGVRHADLLMQLASWLRSAFLQTGGEWLRPRLPAELVEHYVADQLATSPALAAAAGRAATGDRAYAALAFLAAASVHAPNARVAACRVIATEPDRLLPMAVSVALRGFGPLDDVLEWVINDRAPDDAALTALSDSIPPGTEVLRRTALSVARLRAQRVTTDQARGAALLALALRLAAVEEHDETVAVTEEAVGIFQRLHEREPARYADQFTTALSAYSLALLDAGRPEAAVAPAGSAVELRERRREHQQSGMEDEGALAGAIVVHARVLSAAGHTTAAIATYERSIVMYRRLAQVWPMPYRAHLASALQGLSNLLGAQGELSAALNMAQEVTEQYRALAAVHPDPYLTSFGMALNNLSGHLAAMGRTQEAADMSRSSVAAYRVAESTLGGLVDAGLAMALHNEDIHLHDVGDMHAAVAAGEEAVAIYWRLAATDRAKFERAVADSLNALSMPYRALGRRDKSMAAVREAVTIYRPWVDREPTRFGNSFAIVLNNLAVDYIESDAPGPAALAAQEGLSLLRRVQGRENVFGTLLTTLSAALARSHRPLEALEASQEAYEVYHELQHRWPDAFRDKLAAAEANLRVRRSEMPGTQAEAG